jgi:hypothetical protein
MPLISPITVGRITRPGMLLSGSTISENLYHTCMEAGDYEDFVELVGNATTGDGVQFR